MGCALTTPNTLLLFPFNLRLNPFSLLLGERETLYAVFFSFVQIVPGWDLS